MKEPREFSGFIVWDLLTSEEAKDKGAKGYEDQRIKPVKEKSKTLEKCFRCGPHMAKALGLLGTVSHE